MVLVLPSYQVKETTLPLMEEDFYFNKQQHNLLLLLHVHLPQPPPPPPPLPHQPLPLHLKTNKVLGVHDVIHQTLSSATTTTTTSLSRAISAKHVVVTGQKAVLYVTSPSEEAAGRTETLARRTSRQKQQQTR